MAEEHIPKLENLDIGGGHWDDAVSISQAQQPSWSMEEGTTDRAGIAVR
jgi:hypothetical protein